MSALAAALFAAETGSHLVDEPRSRRFAAFSRSFDEAAYIGRLAAAGLAWLSRDDPSFPPRLSNIHDPPLGLFVRATRPFVPDERPVAAVVGARACSGYGTSVAHGIARELAAAGVVVVSGLARGIDAAAHRGALEAGETIAVLGCGVDRDYPRAHAELGKQIAEQGFVVSEYAPGVDPAPWRFPARNRIIAGLADVTIVVEARERSGALITADLALDEGREVLAVPGEITSALSRGTNHLLRLGAAPVTCVADVFRALGVEPHVKEQATVEPRLAVVLALVADSPASLDELARRSGISPSDLAARITELELTGAIVQSEGLYRASP